MCIKIASAVQIYIKKSSVTLVVGHFYDILKNGYSSPKNEHYVIDLQPCRTFQCWCGIHVQTDYSSNADDWMLGGAMR